MMKRITIAKIIRNNSNRMRPMPTKPIFYGRGLRLAGQHGGCAKRPRKFAGLRKQHVKKRRLFEGLRTQRGGCKMQGKGISVAGQHGGFKLKRFLNRNVIKPAERKVINPAGRWLSKNIVNASSVVGNLLPFAALAL